MNTTQKHSIRWFVYDRDGMGGIERIPHTARMAGKWLGWDVECSCGWGTKQSGRAGMVKARVEEERVWHLWEHGINAGFLRPLGGRRAAEAWQTVSGDTTPLAPVTVAPQSG